MKRRDARPLPLLHTSIVLLGAFTLTSACVVAPTNPCDPDAPPELQATVSLSGTVENQFGTLRPGVQVTLRDTGLAAITDDQGRFTFPEVRQRLEGYEALAVVAAPAASGRTITGPISCTSANDISLVIAEPPRAPVVEITKATAPDRLFVAFNETNTEITGGTVAGEDDALSNGHAAKLHYRIQVRRPFGPWNDAALRAVPVYTGEQDVRATALPTLLDDDARFGCEFFAYAFPDLQNEVDNVDNHARCAEVVGEYVTDLAGSDPVLQPLEAYASYNVRVKAEVELPDALRALALPARIVSADSLSAKQLTLAPTAEMDVTLGATKEENDAIIQNLNVRMLAPVAGQRFAALEGDGLMVIDAAHVAVTEAPDAMSADAYNAPEESFGFDDSTSAEVQDEVTAGGSRGISMLPAGKWVRVWKDRGSDAMVDKVWIGSTSESEPANDSPPEMVVDLDLETSSAASDFLGFEWMLAPGAPDAANYNPPDAYILKFRRGFSLFLQPCGADGNDCFMSVDLGGGTDGLGAGDAYFEGSGASGIPFADLSAMSGPEGYLCDYMGGAAGTQNLGGGASSIGTCFDIRQVDAEAELSDITVLQSDANDTSILSTIHLFADQNSDQVFFVPSRELFPVAGAVNGLPLAETMQSVRVGLNPIALQPSFMPDCDGAPAPLDEDGEPLDTRTPVVVSANFGSHDLSVLRVRHDPNSSALGVLEEGVIPLPAAPQSFFTDPAGPTCDDPYMWVVLEDGRMVPVDMRERFLNLPDCDGTSCAVSSRNRAQAGAVARHDGSSRVLFGGIGTLSEVGYLRPIRLGAE